ncbi:MAG: trehalose-phosphatase [Inquilinus sp.]|nr:trehalose-phosphatase [Inquilinus sp.]
MADNDPAETRLVADLPSALDTFDSFADRLDGRIPAVFLDYDGTLTPIVARPDLAILSDEARSVVSRLASCVPVAVISGRDRPDVERLVGIDNLVFAGSHGFDIRAPGGRHLEHGVGGEFGPALDRAEARLRALLGAIGGALVERKKYSIAAHYRQVVEGDLAAFRSALDTVLAEEPTLKRMRGKKVVEIEPKLDWDKGKAVLWLLDALGLDNDDHVAVFLGDDVTDEDALSALRMRGLGIVVANPLEEPGRTTAAAFRVDDPAQAVAFLGRLADLYSDKEN